MSSHSQAEHALHACARSTFCIACTHTLGGGKTPSLSYLFSVALSVKQLGQCVISPLPCCICFLKNLNKSFLSGCAAWQLVGRHSTRRLRSGDKGRQSVGVVITPWLLAEGGQDRPLGLGQDLSLPLLSATHALESPTEKEQLSHKGGCLDKLRPCQSGGASYLPSL